MHRCRLHGYSFDDKSRCVVGSYFVLFVDAVVVLAATKNVPK